MEGSKTKEKSAKVDITPQGCTHGLNEPGIFKFLAAGSEHFRIRHTRWHITIRSSSLLTCIMVQRLLHGSLHFTLPSFQLNKSFLTCTNWRPTPFLNQTEFGSKSSKIFGHHDVWISHAAISEACTCAAVANWKPNLTAYTLLEPALGTKLRYMMDWSRWFLQRPSSVKDESCQEVRYKKSSSRISVAADSLLLYCPQRPTS